jgi:hypothetical protein
MVRRGPGPEQRSDHRSPGPRPTTQIFPSLQLFLNRPTPIANGQAFLSDSPFQLSTTNESTFWNRKIPADYDNGNDKSLVSWAVDPGPAGLGRP